LRKPDGEFLNLTNPIQLNGTGLMLALFDLAEQLSARGKCTINCEKSVSMDDPDAALSLCRAAPEICRTPRDAPPAEFTISLSEDQIAISLQIVKKGDRPHDNAALVRLRMTAIGGDCIVETATEPRLLRCAFLERSTTDDLPSPTGRQPDSSA
jgi:hypothetical protein